MKSQRIRILVQRNEITGCRIWQHVQAMTEVVDNREEKILCIIDRETVMFEVEHDEGDGDSYSYFYEPKDHAEAVKDFNAAREAKAGKGGES